MEGIDIESEEPPEVLTQVLDVLRQYLGSGEPGIDSLSGSDAPLAKAVCSELLVRVSTAPKSVSALKDAASVMVTSNADDRALQVSSIDSLSGSDVPLTKSELLVRVSTAPKFVSALKYVASVVVTTNADDRALNYH